MKYIIFDFNGTIIDDVDCGRRCINQTMKDFKVNHEELSMDDYLHIFTFPVEDYYTKIGFDWNLYTFEQTGQCWFKYYNEGYRNCKVFDGIIDVLKKNHELGNKNVVLSASYLPHLIEQLKFFGIYEYFDEVVGIENIYGASKTDAALKFIKDKNPKDCLLIGDTLHDKEVAELMGIDYVLVARGHQAKDVLLKETDKVVDDIREVKLCA